MPEHSIQQLLANIAAATRPEDFHQAAMRNLQRMDALNDGIIEQKGLKLACRKGCSLCCSLRVDVFAHEVLLIADHIRAHYSAEQIEALQERLDAHADAVLPLTTFEHVSTNIPCPMLQDGACSIYEVRPQSCRRHHSQDLAACQFTYDHPADLETPAAHDRELYLSMSAAMQENIDAYSSAGFDYTIYELGTALYEALADPSTWEHWRAKEETFVVASVTAPA